jgi:demethoxyubiquinone hydroxylase (CLK1/Coq7/Cat5 family)
MIDEIIDLKKEQIASANRPRYKYSIAARILFLAMDIVTGRKSTLSKAKLLETLACIPYREWEIRQYIRMTRRYRNQEFVNWADAILKWGRAAQDNEYMHLLVMNEKMKEDGIKDAWYLFPFIPYFMVLSYIPLSRMLALFSIRRAFLFMAEFEDHAEHVYAQFVSENPEWDEQPVKNELVKTYADVDTWGDVFRRVGLDERDHRNNCFAACGKPEYIFKYEGMPSSNDLFY